MRKKFIFKSIIAGFIILFLMIDCDCDSSGKSDPDRNLELFLGEPAFRVDTLQIDEELVRVDDDPECMEDRSCNALGGFVASMANPNLQMALDEGLANIIFIYRGLTEDNWEGPTDIICAAINGLCGVPDAPADCEGGETEFYIDPAYYGPTPEQPNLGEKDLHLVFKDITVTAGYTEVDVEELSLPFPIDDELVNLIACNLIASGTVEPDLSGFSDGLLTGAITEDSFAELVEEGIGIPWDFAKLFLGEPDTDCDGDPAYSVLMISTGIALTLYEVP